MAFANVYEPVEPMAGYRLRVSCVSVFHFELGFYSLTCQWATSLDLTLRNFGAQGQMFSCKLVLSCKHDLKQSETKSCETE